MIPRPQRANPAEQQACLFWLSCRLADSQVEDARLIGRANLEALARRYPKLAGRVREKITERLYAEALS